MIIDTPFLVRQILEDNRKQDQEDIEKYRNTNHEEFDIGMVSGT